MLLAEVVTIFGPKVVKIFAQHNNEKICKLCKAIFSAHYNNFQPNFGILLLCEKLLSKPKGCRLIIKTARVDCVYEIFT